MSKKQRGSGFVSFIIFMIFVGAFAFYMYTSHPKSIDTLKNYFKKDNSLEAASGEIYDNVVYRDGVEFDYLSGYDSMTVAPLENAVITSHFGSRTDPVTGKLGAGHHGIDLAADKGSVIRCYKDGRVSGVEYGDPVYGNCVTVTHDDCESFYAHLSELSVTGGQYLEAGDKIGIIGDTGKTTGTHLHFELHIEGARVDPYSYLYEKI